MHKPRVTSPPSPPSRRRRRIVVTIAVLVLASLCSWWYWPRGDARFVGVWSADDPTNPAAAGGTIVLARHGRGEFRRTDGSLAISFPWCIERNELVIGSKSRGAAAQAFDWTATQLGGITGWTFLPTEERFPIVEVGGDVIDLQSPDRNPLRMTRLPE